MDPMEASKEGAADMNTTGNGAAGMTADMKAEHDAKLREELAECEEEVNMLKQTLLSKQRRVQDLKKELGISPLAGLQSNVNDKLHQISESDVMQKTNAALKAAGEKTSAAFSSVGRKLDNVKNSELVKSFEEKVGHAYDHVKNEWTKKRSKSLFALEGEGKVAGGKSNPTTPATDDPTPIVNENAHD